MRISTIAIKGVIVGALLSAAPPPAVASEAELMMRSGPGSSFRIPQGSSWSSATPRLNDAGMAALTINAVAPSFNAGIWQGTLADGEIVNVSAEDSALYSDVDINAAGDMVWRRAFSAADGIVKYDAAGQSSALLTNAPIGASSWIATQIIDNGLVAYRAGFGNGNAWTSFDSGTTTIRLAETGVDNTSPYAFLFSPSVNQDGLMAGKAAYQDFSQNRIITATLDGTVTVLVNDNNLDENSPFSGFDNSVGFNDLGQVAFVGNIPGTGRGVFVSDGDGWVQYAVPGEDGLDSIEFFAPALNNVGQVVFRGFHDDGRRAIWLADGNSVQIVAAENDIVQTDIGPARLQSADAIGGPNFGGAVAINNQGDIAFVALLTDPESSATNFGRGLFLVRGLPEDALFADRFESEP
jgi:hypothetical protein